LVSFHALEHKKWKKPAREIYLKVIKEYYG
jgi:hypothetical protein